MKPRIRAYSYDYYSWLGFNLVTSAQLSLDHHQSKAPKYKGVNELHGWTRKPADKEVPPYFLFRYNPSDDHFTRMIKLEIARDRYEMKYINKTP